MSKGGMQAGQGIILTKPLGTGTIMAAAMRRKAKGRWISGHTHTLTNSHMHMRPHQQTFCLLTSHEMASLISQTPNLFSLCS